MVPATFVPNKNAATKLKNAAHTTACAGVNTRVETTVAIELAASWNPFKKSKISATKTMKKMKVVMPVRHDGTEARRHEGKDSACISLRAFVPSCLRAYSYPFFK